MTNTQRPPHIYSNHKVAKLLGKICEIVIPIRDSFFEANKESAVVVCTLSSMNLLKRVRNDKDALNRIAAAGRLLSENKGIDALVTYCVENKISTILLCGNDARGHKAGDALVCLYKYATDKDNKIINSSSPYPYVSLSKQYVVSFQKNICIIDKRGETNWDKLKADHLGLQYSGESASNNTYD